MQRLVRQFEIIENEIIEMLNNYEALQLKYNELKETNKLLERKYNIELEKTRKKNKIDQNHVDDQKIILNRMEINKYIEEIDNCLDVLNTIKK